MSNWGSAVAGAVGAVANVGVQEIDRQQKLQDQSDAEVRAANLKLDMNTRMLAIEEAQKNRAAERFAAITQQKMGQGVPMEAPSVDKTGLTDASTETQFTPSAGGDPELASFHGDQAQTLMMAQATLRSPGATPQQKRDAQEVIDAISAQTGKQADINAKSVEGKTRKPTITEARDAALAETATSDAPAFIAGTSMWKGAMDSERKDREDALRSKDRALDRASDEKRTTIAAEQRAKSTAAETDRKAAADAARDATNQKRIEALAGGKGAKATALMQNISMLEARGYDKDAIDRFIFQTKDSSKMEKVFKMLNGNNNKYGELKLDDAVQQVDELEKATGGAAKRPSTSTPAATGKVRKYNPATGKLE